MTDRENYLRNATMQGPEWIPCTVGILDASWDQLRHDLEDVLARHPLLFPGFEKGRRDYEQWDYGPAARAQERFTDAWGCVWRTSTDGVHGVVANHPLDDWANLDSYRAPDPLTQDDYASIDWEERRAAVEEARQSGRLTQGGITHGFMLMRLWDLRGFENLMVDMAADAPELARLIEIVRGVAAQRVERWLSIGVDLMEFAEDLGTQSASIISPQMFGKYVAPAYRALMQPCRQAGSQVALHSDGYIMDLVDQLIECGVTIINPQDLCNGIDNLAQHVKGRACIRLDIDRQSIVPFGTRREIRALIEEEVRKLGSPSGGLELTAAICPPTPAENVDAVCCALEEFRTYWWDGKAGT